MQSRAGPLLVTNRHVVTGSNVFTNENFGMPDSLRVFHHKVGAVGERVQKIQSLYSEDKPGWFDHPHFTDTADFVALLNARMLADGIKEILDLATPEAGAGK